MAQPVYNNVDHGQQSWDADLQSNINQQRVSVIVPEYANFAALPAAGANNNCLATTTDTNTLWKSDGTSWTAITPGLSAGLRTRRIEGLQVEYEGTTSVTVRPGSCRNIADTGDLALAAKTTADLSTKHLAGTGFAQINGIDEKGLDNLVSGSITCSQTTTTITATGDVVPHLGSRSITGTITTVSTALTGSGTKFTEELSVGDLVGSSTTFGWSLVTAIASDTAATLIAALPGGDATAIAATVIHNAFIQPAAGACDRVSTINSAGTAIVVPTSATHAASSALTVGGAVKQGAGTTIQWLAVWLIDNGTTTATLLSTQHVDLLAIPAGYTAKRRVGWTPYGDTDTSGDRMGEVYYTDGGLHRYAAIVGDLLPVRLASQSTINTWTRFPFSTAEGQGTAMPRTSKRVRCFYRQVVLNTLGGAAHTGRTRLPPSTGSGNAYSDVLQTTAGNRAFLSLEILTDGAQATGLFLSTGASATGTVALTPHGFYDDL